MNTKHLIPFLAIGLPLVGCGGAGSTVSQNTFAGTYKSTMSLDGGKSGVLDLSVAGTGAATGTLNVAAGAAARGRGDFAFTVGTHTLTGTIGSDGTINLSGTDSGDSAGNFTVTGALLSGGAGNISINAGGSVFSGTISATTGGGGGGGGALTFSSGNGTNADLSAYPSNPMIFMSTVGDSSSIVASPAGGGNARTLALLLLPDATPGSTITFTGAQFNASSFIYGEGGTKSWLATSGTAKINSRTANSFSITFTNVTMTAEGDTAATGTFVVNGTLSK